MYFMQVFTHTYYIKYVYENGNLWFVKLYISKVLGI